MSISFEIRMITSNLYESDFYGWTLEQSQLLREGKLCSIDLTNIIEEIESLGKQQQQELRNRLGILIGHLLKWEYQPQLRGKSWRSTIRVQRKEVLKILGENPSLKSYLAEAIERAYDLGLDLVIQETPLDDQDLPSECPYTQEQILDPLFPLGIDEAGSK